MSDGVRIPQFLKALSEIAREAANPAVSPVWNTEIEALKRRVEGGECTSLEALSGGLLAIENDGSQSSCRPRIEIVI
jgi:hypothetical protein